MKLPLQKFSNRRCQGKSNSHGLLDLNFSNRVKKKTPLISHDLTEVRRRAMAGIAMKFGEELKVDICMQVLVLTFMIFSV